MTDLYINIYIHISIKLLKYEIYILFYILIKISVITYKIVFIEKN